MSLGVSAGAGAGDAVGCVSVMLPAGLVPEVLSRLSVAEEKLKPWVDGSVALAGVSFTRFERLPLKVSTLV